MKLIACLAIFITTTTAADGLHFRNPVEASIVEAALSTQVSPVLLAGLCYHESTFHADKIHHHDGESDSYGLCQVKLSIARAMGYTGPVRGLLDPTTNATIAARVLRYQERRTHSQDEMLAAYNAGRVRRKGGVIRNIKYVRAVEASASQFTYLEAL